MDNNKTNKKEIVTISIFLFLLIFTIFENVIHEFSPANQIMSSIYIILIAIGTILIWFKAKHKIFKTEPNQPHSKTIGQFICTIFFSAILLSPSIGIISFTNRTIGEPEEYFMDANILELDSIHQYNKDNIYDLTIEDRNTGTTFDFEIEYQEYRRLKNKKRFKKTLYKGFWGFIYKY